MRPPRSAAKTPRGRSLRRRIATGIVGVATLAVLLFALPLAVAVGRLYRSQELAKLQTDATRVAALVPDNPVFAGQRIAIPRTPTRRAVGIYTTGGRLAGGVGPAQSAIAAAARDGRAHDGNESGQLAVSVPVPSDRQVVAVVRAAVPAAAISGRTHRSWAAMAVLGLGVIAIATALAQRQARRIATPLERLTAAARELGDGNFAVDLAASDIREADVAATALRDTASRLGRLLERERAFSADASHQLRTPLTGLLLGLESALARPEADRELAQHDALDRARHLEGTIDDLLALRRDVGGVPHSVTLPKSLPAIVERWVPVLAGAKRELTLTMAAGTPPVAASEGALRQILDVLLDNAFQHGNGLVTVRVVELGDAVAVEVSDEGSGLLGDPEEAFARRSPSQRGHGIGLALARALAEADGGRLIARRTRPRPVLQLLLPVVEPDPHEAPPTSLGS